MTEAKRIGCCVLVGLLVSVLIIVGKEYFGHPIELASKFGVMFGCIGLLVLATSPLEFSAKNSENDDS